VGQVGEHALPDRLGGREAGGHGVEAVGEGGELRAQPGVGYPGVVSAGGYPARRGGQVRHGRGDAARHQPCHGQRGQRRDGHRHAQRQQDGAGERLVDMAPSVRRDGTEGHAQMGVEDLRDDQQRDGQQCGGAGEYDQPGRGEQPRAQADAGPAAWWSGGGLVAHPVPIR